MSNSLPRLSLCLPTYNRAVLLACALEAVLSQVTPALASDVEVVVLDNASPDETPSVVVRAQDLYPHVPLRSVRHAENIGPDANFVAAVTEARGEFVYLLSDDDVLLPGAVERLLTLIQEHPDFDAFCLNVTQFWETPDEEPRGDYALPAAQFFHKPERLIESCDEALLFLQTHITFMSCISFRRENVAGRDYADKFATNLGQAYMFVDALAPGRGFCAVHQPYLAQRADNNEGFDFFRVFVTNFYDLLRYAQQIGYSEDTVQRLLKRHLEYIYQFVLIFKQRGGWGTLRPNYWDGARRLYRVYGANKFLLGWLIPIMFTPRAVFITLLQMYKSVKPRFFKKGLSRL